MGDFNIDLLNFDTWQLSQDYVHMLSSYFIIPEIIQPTRITDHTATIIDNIFISYTEQTNLHMCAYSDKTLISKLFTFD